ncbi:hypothetical protein ASPVEDRAFT_80524 [Aspergillus versicolor CBS 583.65]|uniref:Uncharacterized protein n=1 Tax=Aspergillus versicolor CBS 583.65 TaxID=1036611 RepID=A0A1L9PBR7_ASPVE|nr:uncharacterized protein ASPVEDRAFT_80524 [Aspergillus versicolor CBS 583.65]OJI98895.1 hypothetical protein ASPVEDRAFT_80524 [Aspergillus versicolor CBS 583.65]
MKFTGIVATLAIAGSAAAAALPGLDVVKVQATVTRIDDVLGNLNSAVDSGALNKADLGDATSELSVVHNTLNTLVGGLVEGITGGASSNSNPVSGVLDLATSGLIPTVTGVLGSTEQVTDFGSLSQGLVGRIQSGAVDAAGLQNILTLVGGNSGLSTLNSVLSSA